MSHSVGGFFGGGMDKRLVPPTTPIVPIRKARSLSGSCCYR
jgi:hypothetical protein